MIESPIQLWIAIPFRRYNNHTILKKKRSYFCQEHNARTLLAGMKALPNYGEDYMREFGTVFPELAKKHELNFSLFYWKGLQGNVSTLNPMDCILLHQDTGLLRTLSGNNSNRCLRPLGVGPISRLLKNSVRLSF